jgi:hypothetical protein
VRRIGDTNIEFGPRSTKLGGVQMRNCFTWHRGTGLLRLAVRGEVMIDAVGGRRSCLCPRQLCVNPVLPFPSTLPNGIKLDRVRLWEDPLMPGNAALVELGKELIQEHRVIEELAGILSVQGNDRQDYSERIEAAILDSLLIRSRSLLDFYWLDELSPRAFKQRARTDAFAHDFFGKDTQAGRSRWDIARAPGRDLMRAWANGKRRVNQEFAHLSYRRTVSPGKPRGQRWWTPEHPWALVVVSGRLFEEALEPSAYDDLAKHLHGLWRPYFNGLSTSGLVEHVQFFVEQGAFTADFTGSPARRQ